MVFLRKLGPNEACVPRLYVLLSSSLVEAPSFLSLIWVKYRPVRVVSTVSRSWKLEPNVVSLSCWNVFVVEGSRVLLLL